MAEENQNQNENENKPVNTGKRKIIAIVSLVVLIAALIGAVCFEGYHIKQQKTARQEARAAQQAAAQPQGKRPSEYKVGKDYNEAVKSGKPVLTLFYADWCRYCIRFMPIYEKVAEKYGGSIEFAKVNVEDAKYENLVRDNKIGGFPTVIIIDKKYDNRVIIPNSNLGTPEDLGGEIERFMNIRKMLDKK